MTLNAFAAQSRMRLYDELIAGLPPSQGVFDEALLAEARVKGRPQMGSTRYAPTEIHFEFIFPDAATSASVLTVTVASPERIVFMPVPPWVVESIWQGEIDGTFHFESEAETLMRSYEAELKGEANQKWFGKRAATRRE